MGHWNCFSSGVERWYINITILCGVGFLVTMFGAVGLLMKHVHEEGEWADVAWLLVIDAVLVMSCVDIFCCPFCRRRARDRCAVQRRRRRHKKHRTVMAMASFDSSARESMLTAQNVAANHQRLV